LLAAWAETGRVDQYPEHIGRYGPIPFDAFSGAAGRRHLIQLIDAAGLLGRGGGAFPTARKLRAVAGNGGKPVVLANGCEGEPASRKDHALIECDPHLILEGAVLAATAIGAREALVCVHDESASHRRLERAVSQHPSKARLRVVGIPPGFVASEESALVNYINTGDARPTNKTPPVFERGVSARPTFVSNVETLAHVALIARFGPQWFRSLGTATSPGTALVSVDGAVREPGVIEVPYGTGIETLIAGAGGVSERVQALLVGGYAGSWMSAVGATGIAFTHEDLAMVKAQIGVSSVIALRASTCGIAETAGVLRYLANESANQCGPCMFGLPAIASDFASLATGGASRDAAFIERLERRLTQIAGRGACAHPDGAIRLASSALRVFAGDVTQHLAGRPCPMAGAVPALPLLQARTAWRGRP
jgi:NADH:ubiquinone oxidoreductase subunit F (NADH-binding)